MRLDPEQMLPEAAQGALALQVRAGEEELVAAADHAETRRRVEPERPCVAAIGAGCLAPVAAHHDGVTLRALIAAEDGSWVEQRVTATTRSRSAERTGRRRRGPGAMRVIVTRPALRTHGAGRLVAARSRRSVPQVVECPLIEIERTSDEPIDARATTG